MSRIAQTAGRLTALALSLGLLAAAGARAASSPVTSGAFSSFPVSVRGVGMGGAYSALASGVGASYHNPAWLAFAETRSVGFSFADVGSMGLVRNVYLDYHQPDGGYGASGLYWNWRGTSVEGPFGQDEMSYAENSLAYAWGKRVTDFLAVGAAVRGCFISTDIPDAGGKGAGLDLALYIVPDPFSSLALVVRNAFSRISWDTGLADDLPREIELGGSYLIIEGFVVAGELRFENARYTAFSMGGEYEIMPRIFMARAGLTRRFDRTSPSFGLGFNHERLRVDYAAEIDSGRSGLGTTHRAGMSYTF